MERLGDQVSTIMALYCVSCEIPLMPAEGVRSFIAHRRRLILVLNACLGLGYKDCWFFILLGSMKLRELGFRTRNIEGRDIDGLLTNPQGKSNRPVSKIGNASFA